MFSTVSMSCGCSILGAILLSYLIEFRTEKDRLHMESQRHNKLLFMIYECVYSIVSNPKINVKVVDCNLLPILKGREHHIKRALVELEMSLSNYINEYGYYIEDDFYKELCELKNQVNEFFNNFERILSIKSLKGLYFFINEGIPNWFEKKMNENFIYNHITL